MKQEHYNWLTDNLVLLGNVRMTKEQSTKVFSIYNEITKENKPQTSCGRCVLNIKKRLRFEYEKFQNLQNKNR
jgi:hypothetical protein